MIKKGLVLGLIACVLFLTACSQASYDDYVEAVALTEQTRSGVREVEVSYFMEIDRSQLSIEDAELISSLNQMTMRLYETFDLSQQMGVTQVYAQYGGIGFDSEVYYDQEGIWVAIPFIGKYAFIDPQMDFSENSLAESFNGLQLSPETLETIKDLYLKSFNKDQVIRGEQTIMATVDGDVKATKYTIDLKEAQFIEFVKEAIETLSRDPQVISTFEAYEAPISLEDLKTIFYEVLDAMQFETFQIVNYIDIDGYIVEEHFLAKVVFDQSLQMPFLSAEFAFNMTLGKINDQVSIIKPPIAPEDIIPIEDLSTEIPKLFEGFQGDQ